VLGLWIEQTEGAKFWLKMFNELRNRGLEDILITVADGLRGFPEAIEAVFPQAHIQTFIVHLIRNSMTLASWKDGKELAAALKPIYQASSADLQRHSGRQSNTGTRPMSCSGCRGATRGAESAGVLKDLACLFQSNSTPNQRATNAHAMKQMTVKPTHTARVCQNPRRGSRKGNTRNIGSVGTTYQKV
jgi:hypothetical protein